jgi:hypothetical protein
MLNVKQKLIKLIENLNDTQLLYAYTLLEKLFGSH